MNNDGRELLTTLPQLNGNISAMADTSKNMSRQVMSIENSAENIINRNRPSNGSKNKPTCTVPAEHSVSKHAADDNCHADETYTQTNKQIYLDFI